MSGAEDDRWRHATLDAADPATAVTQADTPREPVTVRKHSTGPFDPPRRERFEERGELGRGGMGRVFEARDSALDRPVAIKQSLTDNEIDLARFERETLITARLQHPGIVPVLDAGRDDSGRPYYVMRKIDGRRLADLIEAAATVTERIALVPRILGAVDAIAYAHARGVIHRDLKSWNVLLGDFGETLVIDWGLARDIDDTSAEPISDRVALDEPSSLTRAGVAYGTPGFMPPEQARGEKLDRRADVYALGAMLLHALQGTHPFAGVSARDAIAKTAADTPADLSAIPEQVPAELTAIVAKAMEPKPGDRYADAAGLAEDLRRFTTGQLVAAHEYSLPELIARWLRKHRVAVTIAVFALVVVVVGGIIAIRRVIAARDRADDAAAAEALRADELLVERADAVIDVDPTRALALLAQLPATSPAWGRAAATYDSAILRGVARGRVAHVKPRSTSIAVAPEGDVVASIGDEGNVVLHDPALAKPARVLAHLDEPTGLVWSGRSLVVATAGGTVMRIDRDDGAHHVLDAGGKAAVIVATPRRLFAIGADHVLRELDLSGAAPRQVAADVRWAISVGEAVAFQRGDQLVVLRGDQLVEVAPISSDDIVVMPVAAPDHKRFALAFPLGDRVVEYEIGDRIVERNRWDTKVRWAAYIDGGGLAAESGLRFSTLAPAGGIGTRLQPTGMLRAATHDGQCGYLSTDDGVFVACPGFTTRIGGKTDVLTDLAIASNRLIGITDHGLLLSYDLGLARPQVLTLAKLVAPTLFAGGRLWTGHDLRAIDPATGTETLFDRLAVRCVTTRHALVMPERPAKTYRFEAIALDNLARSPVATAPGAQCSTTDDRVALIESTKLTVRDLESGGDRVLEFDHAPDRVSFGGRWLAAGTAATGVIERVDLETGERARTQIDGLRDLAIDPFGRIAIARENDALIWDGEHPASPFAKDVIVVLYNPIGLVAVTRDWTVVVFDEHGERRSYHQGSAFAPSLSLRRPYAAMAQTDGSVVVVDLRDGSLRRYPVPAVGTLIDVDGTAIYAANGKFAYTSRIDNRPPQVLRAALDQVTNARVTPGSSRVEFADP